MYISQSFKPHLRPLAALILIWLITRTLLFFTYWPWVQGDTQSYYFLVHCAIVQNLNRFIGDRTPLYPCLVFFAWLLNGMPHDQTILAGQTVMIIQMLLGLATALCLYASLVTLTRNRLLAIVITAIELLSLNLAATEVTILTECLTLFLVTATFTYAIHMRRLFTTRSYLFLGILTAATALTRPNNLFLLPLFLLAILLGYFHDGAIHQRLRQSLVYATATLLPVLLWCTLIDLHIGHFRLVTTTGMNLTNKTIDYIHFAPDRYQDLKSILLSYQHDSLVAHQQTLLLKYPAARIWTAYRSLTSLPRYASLPGYTRSDALSSDLLAMNLALISAHPALYLQSVLDSCQRFWIPSQFQPVALDNTWDPKTCLNTNVVRNPALQNALYSISAITMIPQFLLIALTGPVAITALIALLLKQPFPATVYLGLSTLLLAMLSCALIEYGEPRFILPYLPILFATNAAALNHLHQRYRPHPPNP